MSVLSCVPWLTNRMAQHVAFEDQPFAVALRMTYYDLRLRLAFLPFVGHWFEPHTDENDSDDEDT
jgi:hypothetical protein